MGTNRLKSRRRHDQGLKWTRVAMAIFSTIGLIDTGSITLKRWGLIGSLSCPGGLNGCEKVLSSPWGTIFENNNFSIPLSLIGFISYLAILILALLPLLPGLNENKIDLSRKTWWGLFFISSSMTIFSLLLIGIMVFKIEAFCFFCVLSAFLSLFILLLSIIGGSWEDPTKLIFRGFIISIIIILGGLIWSSNVEPKKEIIQSNIIGIPPVVTTRSNKASIALAEYLTSNDVVMYTAYWCPHCHEQKELFGQEASSKLNLVECAKDGKNNKRTLCQLKGIDGYPSWEINGNIESGIKSLNELADLTGFKGERDFAK